MSNEVNKGRKHIRNTQLCDTQRKTEGALAQEGATTAETSAESQNWIYVKRHRSRLGQILQETHFRPSLH